jgi:hypothetical protein
MPAHTQAHVQHTPPALSETEWAAARWEDDGGPAHTPPPGPQAGQWLRIAAALGERLPELAGREDVLVTCEEQTRSGAPAAFFPTLAALEIDRALFAPLNPAAIDPSRVGDEENYPVAWGAFTHEAEHAAHSRWTTPALLRGTALDAAAALLEESRAEHAHLHRRPGDRRFLRSAVHTLILGDFTSQTPTDRWQAASAAGLILARRDAGILDPDETEPLEQTVTAILGEDLLEALARIWTAAHATGDDDGQAMLQHAEAWCQALSTDPAGAEPAPDPACGRRGELAGAIGKVVGQVRANEAAQAAAQARVDAARTARAQAKAAQAARQRQAAQTAEKVFASGGRPYTPGKPVKGKRGDRHPPAHQQREGGRRAVGPGAAGRRLPGTHHHRHRLDGPARTPQHAPGPGPGCPAGRRRHPDRDPMDTHRAPAEPDPAATGGDRGGRLRLHEPGRRTDRLSRLDPRQSSRPHRPRLAQRDRHLRPVGHRDYHARTRTNAGHPVRRQRHGPQPRRGNRRPDSGS